MRLPLSVKSVTRRSFLLAAGALLALVPLPWRRARAQGSSLNALPREALVIGNSKYAEVPLKNPGNDARAIAGQLKAAGFNVTLKLDTGREELAAALQAFTAELAKKKCVGLFYYAGHGAQLAWRNYLIPVDAVIEKLDDIQSKAVDLGTLLGGLTRAANPMNVVILDACRDNPFGNRVPADRKGLSQYDAPPGSLLAYATAPGNVASDGEGANGLYTENLLKELTAQDAKIEDVFKRVRLSVRRRTEGKQIPWESTSLEEDFYFLPPKQVRKLAEAELEKHFQEELAIWEKIKTATQPAPLEDYLRRYPSGKFSELAQYRLDQVLAKLGEKKIEAESAKDNPFTKGVARIDTDYRIGDTYVFRDLDLYTRNETGKARLVVQEITETEVRFQNGVVTDLFGNVIMAGKGHRYTGAQFFIPEYAIGKRWRTQFRVSYPQGGDGDNNLDFRVTRREPVRVPAGAFDAFKVEGEGWGTLPGGGGSMHSTFTYWIAPGVRRPIANETLNRHSNGKVLQSNRRELVAYTQG